MYYNYSQVFKFLFPFIPYTINTIYYHLNCSIIIINNILFFNGHNCCPLQAQLSINERIWNDNNDFITSIRFRCTFFNKFRGYWTPLAFRTMKMGVMMIRIPFGTVLTAFVFGANPYSLVCVCVMYDLYLCFIYKPNCFGNDRSQHDTFISHINDNAVENVINSWYCLIRCV